MTLTGTVDGLILLDRVLNDDDVDYLAKRIPIVMLAGRGDLTSAVTVRVDNDQAMRSLAEHLIVVHGLTRLGFVPGANESPDSVARANRLSAAVSEAGRDARRGRLPPGRLDLGGRRGGDEGRV